MIKLIATDMDGTMLTEEKTYDRTLFREDFALMKEKGYYFVVASGNQYELLLSRFDDDIKDEIIYVAENGTKIVMNGKTIHTDTISKENDRKIIEVLKQYPHCMSVFCGVKHAYVLKTFKDKEEHLRKYYQNYVFVDSFDEINDDCLKFSISNWDDIDNDTKEIASKIPDDVRLVTSGNVWFDIFNKTTNKGEGMKYLMQRLHLSKDECAAFGDQLNDLEMLQAVTYGYCMSNGDEVVKKAAYEVIGNNDEGAMLLKMDQIIKEQ